MDVFYQGQSITKRMTFAGSVTGTPTAQLYRNGTATGSPVNGSGSGAVWVFAVTIPSGGTEGDSLQIEAAATVSGVTQLLTIAEGVQVTLQDFASISATLATINSGVATLLSTLDGNVSDGGVIGSKQIMRITRNDAYDDIANAAKQVIVSTDYTGWSGTMTIRHRVLGSVLLAVSVTVASATLLRVSMSSADTAFASLTSEDDFGPHPFDIQMTSGSSRQTIHGIAIITRDFTLT